MALAPRRAAQIINRYARRCRTLGTMTETSNSPIGLDNLDALAASLPAQPPSPSQSQSPSPSFAGSAGSPPPLLQPQPEAGPSRLRAADKWLKPHGPPVGIAFGARLLGEEEDVWSHNAWDHVELPDDFNERAEEIMERHRSSPVSPDIRGGCSPTPCDLDLMVVQTITTNDPRGTGTSSTRTTRKRECDADVQSSAFAFSLLSL